MSSNIILVDGILNKYYRLVFSEDCYSYHSNPLLPIPNRLEAIFGECYEKAKSS